MSLPDVRLVAVVGPPVVPIAEIADAARAAEAGGATAIQIRVKESAGLYYALAERLATELSVPLYVNDRADIAIAVGAAGVHIGSEDLPPTLVRTLAPRPFRIGLSVGTTGEAAAAAKADVDYWSVGAIYATTTKPDAGAPIGAEGFRTLKVQAPRGLPVIAIGGIDDSNAAQVIASGADGIAVSRAIFAAPNIRMATERLRAVVDRALP